MFIAPSKFILAGEHFVVHGGRCVALTCEHFSTRVEIKQIMRVTFNGKSIKRESPPLRCVFPEALEQSLGANEIARFERSATMLCRRAYEMLLPGEQSPGLKVTIDSNIPPGQGAGSSSALCVAMVSALLDHAGYPEPMPNYLQWFARRLELNLHTPVSGVDNAVIAHRGTFLFSAAEGLKRLKSSQSVHFVVATTGPRKSSNRGFEALRNMRKMGMASFAEVIDAADSIAIRLSEVLVEGDGAVVGHCMQASQALLEELGVSTPKIDEAIAVALEAGAYGAKLTGAGCGGFVIACVAPEQIEAVEAAWATLGLNEITHFHSHT